MGKLILKLKFLSLLLLSFLVSSMFAYAQERVTGGGILEVLDVEFFERKSRGKLDSCEITYLIAFQDHVYRQGKLSAIRGSVNFMGFIDSPDKAPAVLLKVTAFDLDNNGGYKIAPLEYAYISSQEQSYAGKEFVVGPAEDGGLLVGYEALKNMYLGVQVSEQMSINFTRKSGRSDISVPVNFGRFNPNATLSYSKCSMELIDGIVNKLN